MTFKFKFRVYVTKYCRPCREAHVQPTHRYIFRYQDGTEVGEARQDAWRWCEAMLEQENQTAARNKKNLYQRPLWQRDIEVV